MVIDKHIVNVFLDGDDFIFTTDMPEKMICVGGGYPTESFKEWFNYYTNYEYEDSLGEMVVVWTNKHYIANIKF